MSTASPSRRTRTPAVPKRLTRLEKAEKFMPVLLNDIAPLHDYSRSVPPPPVRHLMSSLRRRELGDIRPCPEAHILRSLLHSESRQFVSAEVISMRGRAACENGFVNYPGGRRMMRVETLETFHMTELKSTEKVAASTVVLGDFNLPNGDVPPNWMIILTDLGRLLIYDIRGGESELIYIYQLPAHTHKFKKLNWNKDNSEIYIYGHSLPRHIDDAETDQDQRLRQPFCEKSLVMAVFSIHPMRFKAMLELDKKWFGNAYSAVLDDDLLITFCSNPHRINMFSFDSLYKEFCTRVIEPEEFSDGLNIVPFNMEISGEPKRLMEIPGNYSSLYFGQNHFLLLEPSSARQIYSIHYLKDLDSGPEMRDLVLRSPLEGCQYTVEMAASGHLTTHSDSSMRLLSFEGVHLSCYHVESLCDGSHRRQVLLAWKTALMPERRCSTEGLWNGGRTSLASAAARGASTSQRPSRAATARVVTDSSHADSSTVRLLNMSYTYDDVLTLVMAYDVSQFDFGAGLANEDNDWISITFLLDSLTGRIIRTLPIEIHADSDHMETGNFSQLCDLNEDILLCTTADGKSTTVESYRLSEPAQKLWLDEVPKKRCSSPYRPSVLNRKERRRKRNQMQRDPDYQP